MGEIAVQAPPPASMRSRVQPAQLAPWFAWPSLEGMPVECAAPDDEPSRDSDHEWVELVASLRQDLERRRTQKSTPQKPAVSGKKAKPAQDEWGLFDPEQCGFSALLKKLDEITVVEDGTH